MDHHHRRTNRRSDQPLKLCPVSRFWNTRRLEREVLQDVERDEGVVRWPFPAVRARAIGLSLSSFAECTLFFFRFFLLFFFVFMGVVDCWWRWGLVAKFLVVSLIFVT